MLGMTARRVQQLVNDGVLPKTLHGKYALTKCIHAYIAHLKSLSDGNVAATPDTCTLAQAIHAANTANGVSDARMQSQSSVGNCAGADSGSNTIKLR